MGRAGRRQAAKEQISAEHTSLLRHCAHFFLGHDKTSHLVFFREVLINCSCPQQNSLIKESYQFSLTTGQGLFAGPETGPVCGHTHTEHTTFVPFPIHPRNQGNSIQSSSWEWPLDDLTGRSPLGHSQELCKQFY